MSLAKLAPETANVRGVEVCCCDISGAALEVAERNARLNGVKPEFRRGDLFEALGPQVLGKERCTEHDVRNGGNRSQHCGGNRSQHCGGNRSRHCGSGGNRTVKMMAELSDFYMKYYKKNLGTKEGIIRKKSSVVL